MSVPFIDLKRLEPGLHERLMEKFSAMTRGAQFIGGEEVTRLEATLQSEVQVAHAVTCANGTDALQLALRALGIGAGDVVLVPDFTFWATFEAVVNVGATPVTVDAEWGDGGVSFAALEQAIREARPRAVLIAHLYGWGSARLGDIRELCRRHEVPLVEDGAQCFGVSHGGEPIYKGAFLSTTSFYPAKVLGAAGDGGAVFTHDAALAERVRRLGNHGRTAHYGFGDVGWNSRLDALQAAFLNLALEHLPQRIASRREAAAFYRQVLPAVGIDCMPVPANYAENGYCNVCLIPDAALKQRLEAALRAAGIGFGNIYPGAMSRQPGADAHSRAHFGKRVADDLAAAVLNLPLFPYVTRQELDEVVAVVRETTQGGRDGR